MPDPVPADGSGFDGVAEVLATAYGFKEVELARLPIGQGAINYRATAQGRSLFVKRYPAGTDLQAEETAIALTQLAGEHGVPVAGVLPSAAGEVLTHRGDVMLSVWEWVSGQTVERGFTRAQQSAVNREVMSGR